MKGALRPTRSIEIYKPKRLSSILID